METIYHDLALKYTLSELLSMRANSPPQLRHIYTAAINLKRDSHEQGSKMENRIREHQHMQAYSDPKRETEEHALPDVEVFQAEYCEECMACSDYDGMISHTDECASDRAFRGSDPTIASGWYWWACFQGCIPDSEPFGPFDTQAEALADAQSHHE
jgi:hypothetical protein